MARASAERGDRYQRLGDAFCAIALYVASLAIPVPLPGLLAFEHALQTLVGCISSPSNALAGDWLLGLSWLANPALWLGMVFLLTGRPWRAALFGELALLLANCALAPYMFCQYVWLASMVYVVYAALRIPSGASAADNPILAGLPFPKLRPIFYPALALPLLVGLLLVLLSQKGFIRSTPLIAEPDPNENVQTGDAARLTILYLAKDAGRPGADKPHTPESASNFWLYRNGWLSKQRFYWTFECRSREECLKAVESIGGVRPKELSPWQPSRYAAIMEGPAYESRNAEPSRKLRLNPWDVRGIKNGLVYESVVSDRDLYYYAIDLDRNRVFHASEIGCFHGDQYDPTRK
jgi:hypothetical protein